jgi:hypothetical protein
MVLQTWLLTSGHAIWNAHIVPCKPHTCSVTNAFRKLTGTINGKAWWGRVAGTHASLPGFWCISTITANAIGDILLCPFKIWKITKRTLGIINFYLYIIDDEKELETISMNMYTYINMHSIFTVNCILITSIIFILYIWSHGILT